MRRVSRKRTTRDSSPAGRAESEQRTMKNVGYKSKAIALAPGIFLCLLSAVDCRSFSAFCRLRRTHGVFRRRLFAFGCHASFIFSLLPPEAYARRFSSLAFRLRQPCVVHFQPFAACRLRTAFFVVSLSPPAIARRSFSAFYRLTPTHGVFRCWLFAFGCHASLIFSLSRPDAYAQRFSSLVIRFRLWIIVHFQPFAACRLRTAFFVVSFSPSAAMRHSFSAFCRLRPTRSVFRCQSFAFGNCASFIFSLLPPDAYAWRFLSSTFCFRMPCVVHFQLFAA